MYNFLASWLAHNKEWLRNMFSAKLKAQANLFNICSISLNAVERLLNEVERFQRLIQQTFASGLVISSGPRSLHETHTRAPFWNDRMDRLYVYNKVGSLLAVFAALGVLNDEDEKPGRGKRRQWIRRRGERALRLWYSLSKTSHKKLLFSNSSMSVSIPSDFFSFFFVRLRWFSFPILQNRLDQLIEKPSPWHTTATPKKLSCFSIVFGSSFIRWRNVVCSFQQSVKAVLRDNGGSVAEWLERRIWNP